MRTRSLRPKDDQYTGPGSGTSPAVRRSSAWRRRPASAGREARDGATDLTPEHGVGCGGAPSLHGRLLDRYGGAARVPRALRQVEHDTDDPRAERGVPPEAREPPIGPQERLL